MSALHQQIMQDAPSGYWPMDETSGSTVYDRAGNGRNGTITGGVTPSVGGPSGLRALAFDGTANAYVTIADNAVWSSHAGASGLWSYEVWLYRSSTGARKSFLSKGVAGGGNDYEILFEVTATDTFDHPVLTTAGANVMSVLATGSSSLNTWQHVAATYDRAAQLLIVYVDGNEVGRDTTASGTSSDTAGALYFGTRNDGPLGSATYAWNGRMSNVAVYGTALSAARIKSHYRAGLRHGVSY